MIVLTLPYPISANVYWRSAVRFNRAVTYVSKEATEFKEQVGWMAKAAGIRAPIVGRVELGIQLFPQRPQDWARRARRNPHGWDDDVRCIDLDNANKVLLDSIKGIVIEDDKWVRRITSERMEPDGEARVVLYVRQLVVPETVQADLLGAAVVTMHDEFEAWARVHLGQGYPLTIEDHVYVSPVTRWAFKAWQAATEAAAKKCDGLVYAIDNGGNPYRREASASRCAAAIRGPAA